MKRHQAFTLTELLIVVVLIALMLGLLLPAVSVNNGGGRRAECINNLKNCSLAVIYYESAHQKYPPSYTRYRDAPASPSYLGWVANLLPYLERKDLHELFEHGKALSAPDAKSLDFQPYKIDHLICPSAGSKDPAPIHYAVNCGRQDVVAPNAAVDWQENGIFFTDFAPAGQTIVTPIRAGYVAKHDGLSMTLLMAENLQTQQTWNEPQPLNSSSGIAAPLEGLTGLLWFPTQPTDRHNQPIGFERSWSDFPKTATGDYDFPAPTAPHYALPSSEHPEIFNAAFCDGSVRCISKAIDYRVYALTMTPHGQEAKEPSAPPSPLTKDQVPNYSHWMATPLEATDLQ